jgi:carbon storage regulator
VLVLSRKEGKRILVGESIVITVVAIEGDQVRIGIDATDDVAILREELLDVPLPPLPKMARRLRR